MEIKPIRWSHSQLEKFKNCPWSWKRIYQDKDVPRSETEQSRWGTYVHKSCEDYVLKGVPLPANVAFAYGAQLQFILPFMASKQLCLVEPELGIDEQGTAVACDDPRCWSHGFIDILAIETQTAWVGDYKTGKSTYPSTQLDLYAAFVFAHYPQVMQVNTGYYRLQHKRVDSAVRTRAQAPELLQSYRTTYANLLSAVASNNFPKVRGSLCGWCEVLDCEKNTARARIERNQA